MSSNCTELKIAVMVSWLCKHPLVRIPCQMQEVSAMNCMEVAPAIVYVTAMHGQAQVGKYEGG